MDYNTFKAFTPMDQIISLAGMTIPDVESARHMMALINVIARGAAGDMDQDFVDKTIDIVFNGEE